MPRATCRCGQLLKVPTDGSDRVLCPNCGAKVRIRREGVAKLPSDGFLRFYCPCGRRLKVDAARPPAHGKCPDCGRVVPVPSTSGPLPPGHPETPTEELDFADLAMLDRWSRKHLGHDAAAPVEESAAPTAVLTRPAPAAAPAAPAPTPTPAAEVATLVDTERIEVGLRVCPNCGRPVHLGAETCRGCGTPVPRR